MFIFFSVFDASTKFSSGIFFGSSYDTGNFDECIQVLIPGKYGFSGQHCMARLKILPVVSVTVEKGYDPKYEQYENIFNISTWHKIVKYGQDISKHPRDETYFAFCIPSSCTYQDLGNSLKPKIHNLEELFSVNLDVTVDRKNCQVQKGYELTKIDLIYLTAVGISVLFGVLCTIYHLSSRSGKFEYTKFSGKKHDILKAFSYVHIIKKITCASKDDGGLQCIHGLKVISMFTVILGHRLMFSIGSPLANPPYVEGFYKKSYFYASFSGDAIIDSFLTSSGFLACYLTLCEINKRKQMINVFIIYLHRFIRLTPAYVVVLGFYCTIFVQLGSGPLWQERIGIEQERCISNWWTNILYINNYVNVDQMCMFQSWYLSCDTHYFLIVPFLVYFLWRKPAIGLILCVVLAVTFSIIPILIIYIYQEDPGLLLYLKLLKDPVMNPSFQKTYIPSHMRASPYFVGVLAGFIKFKMQTSGSKIPNKIMYLSWMISIINVFLIQLLTYLFYQPTEEKNFLFSGIYESMHHFLWSVCIAWCILGVSEGCGNWIAPILNWKPWIILSRLTYTTYLCHAAIQLYSVGTIRYPIYVNATIMAFYVASDIVFAYIAGFFLSLCFESPIMELEKIFFRRHSLSDESLASLSGRISESTNRDVKKM